MVSFSSHFIDELLARVSLATFLSRYTKLEKRGKSHTGLCPFHREKTPSFHVDDEKGLYHCFGCNASGNALTFLTQHQNLPFPEAVKELAESHNIPLPKTTSSPQQQQHHQTFNRLLEVMEKTSLFFQHNLYADNAESRHALAYLLEERKLTRETLTHFRIGFAPHDRKALISHLSSQGCLAEDIQTLGLTSSENALSFFHNRIMIPVSDSTQRVIAFGGRFLGDAAKARTGKYINSRTSPLFDKSRVLFNIHAAKKARGHHASPLIFVEGYMDVIILHQYGFSPCVAALGTASSLHHIQNLWHFSPTPLICFDGDDAGKKATERLLTLALPLISTQKTLAFIHLPHPHDPDSLLIAGKKSDFQDLIQNPTPLSAELWLHLSSKHPHNTPEDHALIEKNALELTAHIQDITLQKHLRSHIRNRIWTQKRTSGNTSPPAPSPAPAPSLLAEKKLYLTLLTLIHYPELLADFQFLLSHLHPQNPPLARLKDALHDALWTTSFSSQDEILSHLEEHSHALSLLKSTNLHHLAPHLSSHDPKSARQCLSALQEQILLTLQKQEELQKLNQLSSASHE